MSTGTLRGELTDCGEGRRMSGLNCKSLYSVKHHSL